MKNNLLGERIRAAREAKGYSQNQLAKLMNTTNVTISRHERGDCTPSVGALQKYSLHLGIDLAPNKSDAELLLKLAGVVAETRSPEALELLVVVGKRLVDGSKGTGD